MTARIVDEYPVSPLQHGMLLHSLSEPHSGTDIEQIVCTLLESVDRTALRQAWERVVARYSVFRTAFRFDGNEEPTQVVYEQAPFRWCDHDWRGLSEQQRQIRLHELLEADRSEGFDMNVAPLLRLTLIRNGEAEFQLLWTFHHALLDGRSFPQVLNEVFAFYEAGRTGQNLQLASPRPYRDYIDWLRAQDFSQADSYWRNLLAGFAAPTPVVVDKIGERGAPGRNFHQADERIFLSETETSHLREFAHEIGITLNTLVQTAWALLLSRYSGEEDVVFGVVRACRKSSVEGADDIAGLFINTLPLRVRINSAITLAELLAQVRAQWTSMRAYEHTPLVRVQKCGALSSGQSLFDTIVMFDNYELSQRLRAQAGPWINRSFRLYEQTGYPLTLTVYADIEMCLQFEYDRARFDASAITRMLHHLKILLRGFLAGPQQFVRNLPFLTESEKAQFDQWNNTQVPYPRNVLLHELFERQVGRSPAAVAVRFQEQQLTYRQLNERSNQLARHLQRLGVKQDSLVGVCMERSLEMVIALLAVLKAGGAYVPIDPDYPQERVTFMLEDAAPAVVLTHNAVAPRLSELNARAVVVDRDWRSIETEETENLAPSTTPESLAYMIYTSGSTGRPKGAMNTHRGICNRLLWMQDQYHLTPADTVLQKTPFSFDVSVWEFFWPLLSGARLAVAAPGGHKDPAYLIKMIRDQHVTVMHFVPSMLAMFLEDHTVTECTSLRQVICSGESLPFELQERFFEKLSAELDNLYGPTEAAVDVTYWHCERQSKRKLVPIGCPVANTQVYVLDRDLRRQPVGIPGELYIGGVQVGRGYHNREELTAERFIPDPFSNSQSARLYRSGDLCRWLPDGNIEYLGRTDFQVKIRGLRIELGEIESVIGEYPPVRSCVVVASQDKAGDPQLVAYVVSQPGDQVSADDLRNYLRGKLPDYMVPSFFVPLQQLPISPNGKVDRKALPAPLPSAIDSPGFLQVAPENDTETKIAQIWQELLGIEKIGRHSNFFDLGGHSLLLIRARNRLEQRFTKQIPIVEMFRRPTVQSLAEFLAGDSEPEFCIRNRKQMEADREAVRARFERRRTRVN